MTQKRRIDDLMVARGLAESTAAGRALIMAGKVVAAEQRVEKPSQMFPDDIEIRIKGESRYVSRAGEKLAGIIADLKLGGELEGQIVLDVGASTGGFTQCCLENGAIQIFAVDVGTNQLAWNLRADPRVVAIENTDIRELVDERVAGCGVVVADISFNSLSRLIPDIRKVSPAAKLYILLVKPQYELSRAEVPDGGIVEENRLRDKACLLVEQACQSVGLKLRAKQDAKISGRHGNREIFLVFTA